MEFTWMHFFDLIGTIAFAISGAVVGIRKNMDLFGVNMLAVTTACGGGLLRDIMIGNVPPSMFKNPFYFVIAAIIANIVFVMMYFHGSVPKILSGAYDRVLFWFDTIGLASFAVGGVMVGVEAGFYGNPFLLVFMGFLTAVGGGALRDIMADQKPDIFVKNIYATAAITGAIVMVATYELFHWEQKSMIAGFAVIIVLRKLAAHFHWNLPRVNQGKG